MFFKNKNQEHSKKCKTQVQAHGCLFCLLFMNRGCFFEFTKCFPEQKLPISFVFTHQLHSRAAHDILTRSCLLNNTSIAVLKGLQTDIRLALPEPQSHSYMLPVAGVAVRLGHEPSPALQCSDLGWFVMYKWRECSCSTRTACSDPAVRGGRLGNLWNSKVTSLFCRRLWQHVTVSLRDGDIDKATEHKRALEERQRNEERLRAETETPWCTKYFLKDISSRAVSCC